MFGCRLAAPLRWRLLFRIVATGGLLYGRALRFMQSRRRLRRIELGPLVLRVPATWGEFEAAREGDFVIRSVPTQYFIYGDALWYAIVAEIRIRSVNHPGRLPADSPMDELRRVVGTKHGRVLVLLRVARGMSPALRGEAERAFRSVRPRRRGSPLEFPEARYGVPALAGGGPPDDPRQYFEGRTVGA